MEIVPDKSNGKKYAFLEGVTIVLHFECLRNINMGVKNNSLELSNHTFFSAWLAFLIEYV